MILRRDVTHRTRLRPRQLCRLLDGTGRAVRRHYEHKRRVLQLLPSVDVALVKEIEGYENLFSHTPSLPPIQSRAYVLFCLLNTKNIENTAVSFTKEIDIFTKSHIKLCRPALMAMW